MFCIKFCQRKERFMKRTMGFVVVVVIGILIVLPAGYALAKNHGAVVIVTCTENSTGGTNADRQPTVLTTQASGDFVFPESCATDVTPALSCAQCLKDLNCGSGFTLVVEQTGTTSIDKFVLQCGQWNDKH
jgi:hypothetical protein